MSAANTLGARHDCRPDVLFNLGFKYTLTENISLITAMGRSFSAKDGDGPAFLGFWGVQFTF